MTDSQLALICLRCNAPASLGPYGTGEDHVPEDRSSKGMGGTSDADVELATLPFCRPCHRDRHLKEFTVERLGEGKVKITEREGKTSIVASPDPLTEEEIGNFMVTYPFIPALTLRGVALRLPFCESRVLAQLWHAGTILGDQGKSMEALAARAFRVKEGRYGGEWYRKTAAYIAEETGVLVSEATVYDRYALAIALDAADWDMNVLRIVGPAALSAAGKVGPVEEAVEKATELREEGLTSRETIREVKATFQPSEDSEPLPEQEWVECNLGYRHRRPKT